MTPEISHFKLVTYTSAQLGIIHPALTRIRGRQGSRPKALDREKRDLAVKLYDENQHTISQICQMMHISKPTLYKYVESAKNQ